MTTVEKTYTGRNFHWGAILSGTAVALGVWVLLYSLGAAIGHSFRNTGGGITTWTVIYALVSPILGLLAGGMVCGMSDKILSKSDGALHGLVVWGLSTVVSLFFIGMDFMRPGTATAGAVSPAYAWGLFGSIILSLAASVSAAGAAAKDRGRAFEGERAPVVHSEVRT